MKAAASPANQDSALQRALSSVVVHLSDTGSQKRRTQRKQLVGHAAFFQDQIERSLEFVRGSLRLHGFQLHGVQLTLKPLVLETKAVRDQGFFLLNPDLCRW